MKIEVNGERMKVDAGNLAGLVVELGYKEMVCAVALNGGFVPRGDHDETRLRENDRVDILAPMKGG